MIITLTLTLTLIFDYEKVDDAGVPQPLTTWLAFVSALIRYAIFGLYLLVQVLCLSGVRGEADECDEENADAKKADRFEWTW